MSLCAACCVCAAVIGLGMAPLAAASPMPTPMHTLKDGEIDFFMTPLVIELLVIVTPNCRLTVRSQYVKLLDHNRMTNRK